ncbi:MAG: AAA family ATPase, partial [Archaeoglobaceae archaeon]
MADDKISLRVKEAYYRDVGRGIARTDPEVIEKLGLKSGDIIEVTGKGKTSVPGIVWPGYPEDRGSGVIRIDGNLRNNAGVGIDDKVTIKKSSAKDAERVTFAPTEPVRLMGGENYLQRLLEGRPIKRGQKIRVEVFGHTLAFQVTGTKPSGIVRVTRNTGIELKEKPVEQVERAVPNVSYEDIGGLKREVRLVREMIELPLKHPELFQRLGIDPPKGVLLQGPPGTGKTLIAKAVANEVDAHYISLSGPEIMSKYYGESEQKLREIFEEAKENTPAVVFIDEIDSIAPKREEVSGEVERRVVAQLLSLMDGLEARGDVVVIAATNRVDALDPALRRPGRFDREIEIGVPDNEGRKEIMEIHTRGMPLAEGVDVNKLADSTLGFVGADLESLAKEAAMHALRRVIPEIDIEQEELSEEALESLEVTEEDFMEALKNVEPSAMREVLVEVPNVRWTDVCGLYKATQ